jgi:anaerobic magnesium-protoporphyrin IX monomethyl ester cyclase
MGKYKGNGSFVRYRSVKNVIREMKGVLKEYKTERILLHDDTFTLRKEWLNEFCSEYSKEIKMPFVANGRVETITEEIVKMLKKAGCMELKIGVEVGNDYIRTKVLKRNMSKEQIIDAFRLCDKYGIKTSSFNMIGIPFETEKNIKETIALNRKIKPYIMGVSVFRPYPGTELYDICKKNKWMSNRKINSYFEDVSILNLPTISPKKISYYHKIFKLEVYYPAAAFFVKILLKLGLYGLFTRTVTGARKLAAKLLTRREKDFLMKFIKF